MLEVSRTFKRAIHTARGNAHNMLAAGQAEMARRRVPNTLMDQIRNAGKIGILAGFFATDEETFITRFEAEVLNG